MRFEFTPASQRALAAAAGWINGTDPNARADFDDGLHVPEVLLGLLSEPECRASLLLAPFGIDAAAARRRFPQMARLSPPDPQRAYRFANDWLTAIHAAESRLVDYPRPLELATEHLLLGIAASDNDASAWFAECGLFADALEAEVHRLAGHQPGPLPLDIADGSGTFVRIAEANEPVEFETPEREAAPQEEIAALRIVDAAANRAAEGLRVVEDYLRLALDDRHLTAVCKALRHELTSALAVYPTAALLAARETQADVGTQLTTPAERFRGDLTSVVTASFKRVEQSLRSLEEVAKISSPAAAAHLKQLRYKIYTLERAVGITRSSAERLATARLYVLVDGGGSQRDFEQRIVTLLAAGVMAFQLRDKRLSDRPLLERARRLRELTAECQALFIMNDRPDLALLAEADGVHVGQEELSVKDARRVLGPNALVGVSTHSIEQARAAVLDGANYIGVGPTFPSGTKNFAEFPGLELARAVAAEIRLPAFAIGGITARNVDQVLATGIPRVAVSGAIAAAPDPAAAARELLAILNA